MNNDDPWAILEDLRRLPRDRLSRRQKIVVAISDADSEIAMSGLLGYYSNSSGDLSGFLVEALNEIGCPKCAEIFQFTNSQFPGGAPNADWRRRLRQLATLSEEVEDSISEAGSRYLLYPDRVGENLELYLLNHGPELRKIIK